MYLNEEMLKRFKQGMDAAVEAGVTEPTAMTLATVGFHDTVSCRTVLLKAWDRMGFVFYTNKTSLKGHQLAENPHAALSFFWGRIEQQVRIEGRASAVTDAESDAYFATRPRISQVGAWASEQSQPLASMQLLQKKVVDFAAQHEGQIIRRPRYWGGIRVEPYRVEFWYGRKYRLHERVCYIAEGERWKKTLLYP
jgi:pyridoxamine 5'-phosphate oxidase